MTIPILNKTLSYLKGLSTTKYCVVFGLLLYLTHFGYRSPADNHTRPIKGDAEAYYAYLPALLIYNDPSYSFIQTQEIEKKYYFENSSKSFLVELKNGNKINKTFPGVAILYLPFFLLAHLIAMLFGYAADGYSNVYQYLFDFGHFFYATLGMVFFYKVLSHFRFNKWKVLLALVVIVLGTNLWYYILLDQSVTHIHNFCLINISVYLFLSFLVNGKIKFAQLLALILGITILTRPTNIITVPFLFIFLSKEQTIWTSLQLFLQRKIIWFTTLVLLIAIAIPILLWKWQADVWLAYSYGEESFDFYNAEVFNFLFSYIKGWFIYTPLALLILLFGIPITLKNNKRQGALILVFYGASIFLFSSWWCWYYGCTMSQRVMVDHYLLLGLLVVYILNYFNYKKLIIIGIPALFFILLNQVQSYQVFNGFFPCANTNSEMYWDQFMCLTPKAKIYEKNNWSKLEEFSISLPGTSNDSITIGDMQTNKKAHSGNQIFKTGKHQEFSGGIRLPPRRYIKDDKIVISVWVQVKDIVKSSRMVVEIGGQQATYTDYYFNRYYIKDAWVQMEFLFEVNKSTSGSLHIYFWNPDLDEEIWYDDIVIEKFKLK